MMVRGLIWLVPLAVAGWLVFSDAMVSGQLTDRYDFNLSSPYILTLAPRSRISAVQYQAGDAYQTLIDDPIYFDVRLPRPVDTITLTMRYRAPAEQPVRLAAFYNKDNWQYQLLDWQTVSPPDAAGWQTATATVAVTDKRFAWQKYQFMISLPDLRGSGREVEVTEITMTASRPPLTIDRVVAKLRRIFHL